MNLTKPTLAAIVRSTPHTTRFLESLGIGAAVLLTALCPARGVNIAPGSPVTQDFSIGTAATASLPADWRAETNKSVRTIGPYSSAVSATERSGGNNMTPSAGNGIYNFGAGDAASATDRAVGFLSSSSATKSGNLYVKLDNSSGSPITSFTISYKVEKYRNGSNAAGFSIQLYYSTDGSSWTSAGGNFTTSFVADADNNGFASAPGATVTVSDKSLPVSVAAGGSLYLAWNYSVTSGSTTSNAQALGVDDISITALGAASNNPPVLTVNPASVDIFVDRAATATVTATDLDAGDTVTITPTSTDIANVANYFDSGTGAFSWTPAAAGTYVVTFTASDTKDTDVETLTIHATVPVPVMTLSRTSTATFPGEPVSVTVSVADPDADELTYTVTSADIPNASQYFDAGTGVFAWSGMAFGTYEVTFRVEDDDGYDEETLAITVTRSATGSYYWDFDTASPTPSASTFGMSCSDLTRGNNNGTTELLTVTSPSSGYAGVSGTYNAGAAAWTNVLNLATNAYFEFTLTRTALTPSVLAVTGISFGNRCTSTGPQQVALFSSRDGFTTPLTTFAVTANSTWALHSYDFPEPYSIRQATTFRLYGYAGVGNPALGTANWRIDDLTVETLQEMQATLILIR